MTTPRLDLLLVNAPSRKGAYGSLSHLSAIEPPVWAGLIATYCRNKGWTVQILDAEAEGLTVEQTVNKCVDAYPRLAVFCIYGHQPSASTQCMPGASAVVKGINHRLGHLVGAHFPTLALGTHPSALPAKTIREEPFDYVCEGEGPYTVERLLAALTPQTFHLPIDAVPGLWSKRGFHTARAENIRDLDRELPEQACDLLPMGKYKPHNWFSWTGGVEGGYASVQTSLSCPFSCTFCSIAAPFGGSGQGYRHWSPANVAAQMANLHQQYGVTNIKIPDEMFCLNKSHVWQICNMLIDMRLGSLLNLWAYARIDTVWDEQLLMHMRNAGFRWLGLGIESASRHVRDGVTKGKFGNEDIIAAVRRVEAAGIEVGANYIFGLPDDTLETMQQTLELACELNTSWANFYCAMAYPGSRLHTEAKERGWRLPEDPGGPGWIGYSQLSPECLPLRTETLTAAQVLDFRDTAFMNYFSRSRYMSKLGKRVGSVAVDEVQEMLSAGKPRRKHREEK